MQLIHTKFRPGDPQTAAMTQQISKPGAGTRPRPLHATPLLHDQLINLLPFLYQGNGAGELNVIVTRQILLTCLYLSLGSTGSLILLDLDAGHGYGDMIGRD